MSGHRVTRVRNTTAEPTAVWAVLTDIDYAARTLSGISAVERVEGTGYEVGTRWRETRRLEANQANASKPAAKGKKRGRPPRPKS